MTALENAPGMRCAGVALGTDVGGGGLGRAVVRGRKGCGGGTAFKYE